MIIYHYKQVDCQTQNLATRHAAEMSCNPHWKNWPGRTP